MGLHTYIIVSVDVCMYEYIYLDMICEHVYVCTYACIDIYKCICICKGESCKDVSNYEMFQTISKI